jgi:hypothetical protein
MPVAVSPDILMFFWLSETVFASAQGLALLLEK